MVRQVGSSPAQYVSLEQPAKVADSARSRRQDQLASHDAMIDEWPMNGTLRHDSVDVRDQRTAIAYSTAVAWSSQRSIQHQCLVKSSLPRHWNSPRLRWERSGSDLSSDTYTLAVA